jgi:hypothetical protein
MQTAAQSQEAAAHPRSTVRAITIAALVLMYVAEEGGRLGGAAEFARQKTNFNFLLGVILTSAATLIVSVVYHRRIERDAERLFRPFDRGKAQEDTVDIGIVSARRIAERHGGELFVESAPGRGTTYFFTLTTD